VYILSMYISINHISMYNSHITFLSLKEGRALAKNGKDNLRYALQA